MEVEKRRIALVVGVSDEIGQRIAVRLAEKGVEIIICDSDEGSFGILLDHIRQKGCRCEAQRVDGTSSAAVRRLVGELRERYGHIDILVNNTDMRCPKPLGEASDEDWESGIRFNLDPAFFFCREVIPGMQAQRYGRVINISSLEYIGLPGKANYAAAKSALFGFTRSLALETARDGVTVNCVAKGDVATAEMDPELAQKISQFVPVKRIGHPDDVAWAVEFFASETSKYVTGQMFFVCGGKSAHFSMSI